MSASSALKASLLAMKKNPKALLDAMKETAEKQSKGGGTKDARFWKPTFDKKTGVGSATIRLLPSPDAGELAWAQVYSRSFKGPTGKWYFENDLSTLGRKDDPVGNMCRRLYNSGIESDKEVQKKYKRKVNYIYNIKVISDPANRENDGKVFLYETGAQIFKIIQDAREAKFEDEVAIEGTDPWCGANLNLRIIGKELNNDIVPNYEKSSFGQVCALADTDDEIFEIISKGYSLKEFVAADKFKTVEELQTLLFEVLGPRVGSGVETVEGWGDGAPAGVKAPKQETAKASDKPAARPAEVPEDEADLDEIMKVAKQEQQDEPSSPVADQDDMEFFETLMG